MTDQPQHPPTLAQGRYRIDRVLGLGGMSVVLQAHDTKMGVDRAIKLLYKRLARNADIRKRFENEARAQARLRHPHILMVHDVVEEEAGIYLVMELAEAGNLARRVRAEGVLSPREVASIGAVLAGALEAAHSEGVIHRDIKPENILIDRYGHLKIADFGIARLHSGEANLTSTGMAMGTWAYMPPEQRESARQVDGRADIYALGTTLYYLLTGKQPPALHNSEAHDRYFEGVPEALAEVIQRATRLYPEDRYQRCSELEAALQAIAADLTEKPIPGFRPDPIAVPATTGVEEALDLAALDRDHPEAFQTLLPLYDEWSRTVAMAPEQAPAGSGDAPPAPPAEQTAPAPSSRVPVLLFVTLGIALLVLPAALILPRILMPDTPEQSAEPSSSIPSLAGVAEGDPPASEEPGSDAPSAADDPDAPSGMTSSLPPSAEPGTPREGGTTTPTREKEAPTPPQPTAEADPPSGSGSPARGPRVITVASTPSQADSSETTREEIEAPQAPMGLLVLRTIPSGAEVFSSGERLVKEGRGYPMPVGRHLLELRAPSGESTRIPLTIQADEAVEVCYSFDTNSACGGGQP